MYLLLFSLPSSSSISSFLKGSRADANPRKEQQEHTHRNLPTQSSIPSWWSSNHWRHRRNQNLWQNSYLGLLWPVSYQVSLQQDVYHWDIQVSPGMLSNMVKHVLRNRANWYWFIHMAWSRVCLNSVIVQTSVVPFFSFLTLLIFQVISSFFSLPCQVEKAIFMPVCSRGDQ